MSRIGRNPIPIPNGVKIQVENQKITISSSQIQFEHILGSNLEIEIKENNLYLKNKDEKKSSKKFYGLNRSLLSNKIYGASEPFRKILNAKGVGYKFQLSGNSLIVNVGYSHPIEFNVPDNIKASVEANTKLILSSPDKEALGLFASRVRKVRPPEPYKGKGIMYENEVILRKVGKSGKK